MASCDASIASDVLSSFGHYRVLYEGNANAILLFGTRVDQLMLTVLTGAANRNQRGPTPMAYTDRQSNTALFDCGSFENAMSSNREPVKHELINLYYLKMIAEAHQSVRMVVVMPYGTLESGQYDRLGHSLERLADLTNSDPTYLQAISVVVVEVPNGETNAAAIEEKVRRTFEALKSQQSWYSSSEKFNKVRQLIESLERGQGVIHADIKTDYTTRTSSLRTFLFDRQPAGVNPDRFQYVLSPQSQTYVECMRDDTRGQLCQNMGMIPDKITEYYKEGIKKQFKQPTKLITQIDQWTSNLEDLARAWNEINANTLSFSKYLLKMRDMMGKSSILEPILKSVYSKHLKVQFFEALLNTPKSVLTQICDQRVTYEFQYFGTNRRFLSKWRTWVQCVQGVDRSFMNRREFFNFEHQYQSYVRRMGELDLENPADQSKYPAVLEIIRENGCDLPTDFDTHYDLDELKMTMLYNLIKERLTVRNQVTCHDDGRLTVTGDVIEFSEVHNLVNEKTTCEKPITELEIYAYQHVDVNDDLYAAGLEQVSIFGPKWKISEGDPKYIIVTGENGVPHVNASATHATAIGGNGADGQAGRSGTHGGHLLGVAKEFVVGARSGLKVFADGGNASDGQHGGNGANGRESHYFGYFVFDIRTILKGRYFYHVHFDHEINYNCRNAPGTGGYNLCRKRSDDEYWILCRESCGGRCTYPPNVTFPNQNVPDIDDWWEWSLKEREPGDKAATKGGNGGKGGVPGLAGIHGQVLLTDLNMVTPPALQETRLNNGTAGVPGHGGNPGLGGKEHDKLLCYHGEEYGKRQGMRLSDGQRGANSTGMEGWVEQPPQKPLKPVQYIERFKHHLRANIDRPYQETDIDAFLHELEDSALVKQHYKINDYVTAFTNLEKQFFEPSKSATALPFYEHLYENVLHLEENDRNAPVLPFLKAGLFTKIAAIKKHLPSSVIVDMKGHFDLMSKNVQEQQKTNEIVVINTDKMQHVRVLEEKIHAAEQLVHSQVAVAITNNVRDIETQISNFLDEIDKLRHTAEDARFTLQAKEKELENAMTMNLIFGILNTVTTVISMLGPVGAVAGAITGGVTKIASSFAEGDINVPTATNTLIGDLASIHDEVTSQKQEIIKKEIEDLRNKLDKPNNDPETIEFVNNISNLDRKVDAEKAKGDKSDENKIRDLQEEQKRLIKEKEDELERNEVAKEQIKKAVKHFNNVVEVADASLNVYKKYEADQDKLTAIRAQMRAQDKNIKKMKEYKTKIEKTVGPMLQGLSKDMSGVAKQLRDKSQVELDVKKWGIQSALLDLKISLRKLTSLIENKNIKENVSDYIDKLELTMNTMINIYDRIETFKEQMELYDYIGQVNTAKSQLTYINDQDVRSVAEDLLAVVRTNTILWQYENFVTQVKQWVFPFATEYLRSMHENAPQTITEYDQDKITAIYTNRIIELNNKLQDYRLEIASEDYKTIRAVFNSDFLSTQPFYIWRRQQHRLAISRLLRGEEVLLYADLAQASFNYNAVKFNLIDLRFKTNGDQVQLDNLLRHVTIHMTHMGESHYRCASDRYVIHTAPQELAFSYETRTDGINRIPVRYNRAYGLLKDGDIKLSPFTVWRVKLVSKRNLEAVFKDFQDIVDLELGGYGSYVEDSSICDHLQDHYAPYKLAEQTGVHQSTMEEIMNLNEELTTKDVVDKYLAMENARVASQRRIRRDAETGGWFNALWDKTTSWANGYLTSEEQPMEETSNVTAAYDINSTLLLMDVICRKLTKKKMEPMAISNTTSMSGTQAAAIHLTAAIEDVINILEPTNETFNPVAVQSELVRLLRTGASTKDVNQYIITSIEENLSATDKAQLDAVLYQSGIIA